MVNLIIARDIFILILSSLALIYSGVLVVKTLVKIAYKMHIKEYILTFVLLAFSTSIPELFVGITSAINKSSVLSLGNIIGANIMDVTFVIGIAAILARRFKFNKNLVRSTSIYAVGIGAVPIALAAIGNELSRIDGIILIAVFFLYMRKVLKDRVDYKNKDGVEELADHEGYKKLDGLRRVYYRVKNKLYFNLLLFIIGIALVFLSADFVTKTAISIASELNMSRFLIGIILVSIGTTLPELTLESRIALTKKRDMAFGDPLGSVVVNSTLVLGIVALIYPVKITSFFFYVGSMFMLAATSLVAIMLNVKKELTWKDGIWLLLFYVVFLIVQLNVSTLLNVL